MAVPKFEDFKAPWEVKDGQPVPEADQVVDKASLKQWAFNLLQDKSKAQVARDTAQTKANELQTKVTELEAAKTAPPAGTTEQDNQIQQLMGLVTQLTKDNQTAKFETDKITILTTKGFDPVEDAALFEGASTKEAVEQRAELLVERGLGGKKKTTDGENNGDDNGQPNVLDGKPPAQLNNGLPPNSVGDKVDVNAFLAQYSSGNPL